MNRSDQPTAQLLLPRVPERPPEPWAARPELDRIRATLLAGGTAALSAAEGQPGIGKTALAQKIYWDAEVRRHFTDGVLWAALGQDPDVPGELARLAASFQADVSEYATMDDRAAAVRDLLRGQTCLLIVDDVWHLPYAQLFRSFPVAALLTTRDHGIARTFAPRGDTTLELLSPEAALALLQELVPDAADLPELASVAAVAQGLPLAVNLLAPLVDDEVRAGLGLGTLVRRLENQAWRQERLTDLMILVDLSLDFLPPELHDAFVQLAVFGARPADFDQPAAAAVWAVDEDTAHDRLAEFRRRNLLDGDKGRFTLHQSIADATAARLPANDPALTRHAAYYLALVNRDREDWRTIAAELPQIRRAGETLAGDDAQLLEFIWAMRLFWERQGLGADQLHWYERGLKAARALGQQGNEAALLSNLGMVYDALGKGRRALEYYKRALPLHEGVGDWTGQARTWANIGTVHLRLGDAEEALKYYDAAWLELMSGDDQAELAKVRSNMGAACEKLRETEDALNYFEEALTLFAAVGNRVGQARTLSNIGRMYANLGESQRALEYYEQALPLLEAGGDRIAWATILSSIGAVYENLEDRGKARAYLEKALPLHEAVGNRREQSVTLYSIARIHIKDGNLAAAERLLTQAVAIDEAIEHPDLESDREVLMQVRAELEEQAKGNPG